MISPYGFETYSEALRAGVEVYHTLKSVLKKQGPEHRPRPTRAASPRR